MKTTKTKSSSYEFFAGNVVFAAISIICACADANAQSWSASPESSWNSSDPAKMVFDSDSDGTLDSTVDTQSSDSSVGLSGAVSLEKRGTGTLTVNGMHSFTGNIDIYGGTYLIGSGTTDKGAARNSQLGDPRAERKITVYTNATLQLARTGVFGAGTAGGDGIKRMLKFAAALSRFRQNRVRHSGICFSITQRSMPMKEQMLNGRCSALPETGWSFRRIQKRHTRSPTTIKAVFHVAHEAG